MALPASPSTQSSSNCKTPWEDVSASCATPFRSAVSDCLLGFLEVPCSRCTAISFVSKYKCSPLKQLEDALGGCERILRNPIPLSFPFSRCNAIPFSDRCSRLQQKQCALPVPSSECNCSTLQWQVPLSKSSAIRSSSKCKWSDATLRSTCKFPPFSPRANGSAHCAPAWLRTVSRLHECLFSVKDLAQLRVNAATNSAAGFDGFMVGMGDDGCAPQMRSVWCGRWWLYMLSRVLWWPGYGSDMNQFEGVVCSRGQGSASLA
eukprot:1160429-Pelagomonas_calceolata.AAC.20